MGGGEDEATGRVDAAVGGGEGARTKRRGARTDDLEGGERGRTQEDQGGTTRGGNETKCSTKRGEATRGKPGMMMRRRGNDDEVTG